MRHIRELSDEVYRDVQRRIRKGHGELVEIVYPDLDSSGDVFEVRETHYIGKMTLGQTGTIVAVIGRVFRQGMDLRRQLGRQDNLAFINALDPHNLAVLIGRIVGKSAAWVDENYDLAWAVPVLAVFFKHNDFFKLFQQVMTLLERNGISTDRARKLAMGQDGARSS